MAEMANHLGAPEEASEWVSRSKSLKQAIRREFVHPDGKIRFLKEVDGTWNGRQHALGTAFCVLGNVLDETASRQALSALTVRWYGVPLFAPFYEDNPHCYHNHSTWPFVDGFVHLAMLKAGLDRGTALARWKALCGRVCRDEKGFRELNDTLTGRITGSPHQLWSAAAYCGACLESS
jgi:hypothetical protein